MSSSRKHLAPRSPPKSTLDDTTYRGTITLTGSVVTRDIHTGQATEILIESLKATEGERVRDFNVHIAPQFCKNFPDRSRDRALTIVQDPRDGTRGLLSRDPEVKASIWCFEDLTRALDDLPDGDGADGTGTITGSVEYLLQPGWKHRCPSPGVFTSSRQG
nr:uncharacterized protein CI109_004131 [Kwoniella shandongensis]KAA5527592.1 hypothetical protein CI109_004131 [Kwoniella shandongensis]